MALDKEFVDALDTYAVQHGDKRVTRAHREALKQAASTRTFNQGGAIVRMKLPTVEEYNRARAVLPIDVRAFILAQHAVMGTFPGRLPGESDKDCRLRVLRQASTNEPLWKKAILTGAEFPVPGWVTSAIAQDQGWRLGPGDLTEQPAVDGAERVHIAGWSDAVDGDPKLFVLYPKVINRGIGPLEIGDTGRVARRTVNLSRWRVYRGWVDSGATPPQTLDPIPDEDDPEGPAPKPT